MVAPAADIDVIDQPRRASGPSRSSAAPRRRSLLGFGILHSLNTALNMAFTLTQLLVLARLLPLERYSQIVFLASIGFYLQPLDQALGKASFVTLHASRSAGLAAAGRRVSVATAAQFALILVMTVAVATALSPISSTAWVENALFLFLCLVTNFWAFELQSTAWALDRNLPFVKLALVHRTAHFCALALGYASGSLLLFVAIACGATLICLVIAAGMFVRAGLLEKGGNVTSWVAYARTFGVALLATMVDLLVLNAPYALISARFGIGPPLVVFDSVMKLARIVMAGARTLAEIALSRHAAFVATGQLRKAQQLFLIVLAGCVGATIGPALAVMFAGSFVFSLLLGGNNVVPHEAMIPAAVILLASALYQPAMFFLGYSNNRRAIQRLTLCAAGGVALFAATIWLGALTPTSMLVLFGACFVALTTIAVLQTWLLFRGSRGA